MTEPPVARPPGELNLDCAAALVAACCSPAGPPRQVVLSPGSRNGPLAVAFAAASQAQVTVILDERQAAFFALGWARQRREAVVLVCTSGSAPSHYYPAILEAYYGQVPLLVLSADRPAELQQCGAPQTIDQRHLFGPHVAAFAHLEAPRDAADPAIWRTQGALALDAAVRRPGPAHLNVAFREPLLPSASRRPAAPPAGGLQHIWHGRPQLHRDEVAQLAAQCAAAPHGALVAGPQAPLTPAVQRLAARLGWPVLLEPTACCDAPVAPEVCWIRHYDILCRPDAAPPPRPHTVLQLGQMPTSKALRRWLGAAPAPQIYRLASRADYPDPDYGVQQLWVGDLTALAEGLLAALPPGPGAAARAHADAWRAADRRVAAACDAFCAQHFFAGSVARQVTGALPPGSCLVVGNSMAVRDVDRFAASATRLQVHCSRGVNGIDGTLATLLGTAAAADAAQPVVGLLGDLTFLHDVGALQLARQLRVAGIAVVLSNGGGAIFDHLEVPLPDAAFDKLFRTPQDADLMALCAAAAVKYVQVASAESLARVLDEALSNRRGGGLQVIDVRLEPPSGGRQAGPPSIYQAALAAFLAASLPPQQEP